MEEIDSIKAKKIELLKKRRADVEKKEIVDNFLVSDKERMLISKELKSNALAVFTKYSFYKDGYKKSLGIIIMSIFIFIISTFSLLHSSFYFEPPKIYLPVNSINQLADPIPLNVSFFEENEIRKFSSEAFEAISNYNYVTVNNSYFSDISKWFTPSSFSKYKENFNLSSEIKVVKENFFVVNQITVEEATINKKESEEVRKKSPEVYLWVVNIKSRRVYQNRTGFTYEDYNTRMIVTRSPVEINEKGLAVHSIVNEKINKNK